MSNFNENLKHFKKEFQIKQKNNDYIFYGAFILITVLGFLGIIPEGKIGIISCIAGGVVAINMILSYIKSLEKRIENIESEIRDINEKSE